MTRISIIQNLQELSHALAWTSCYVFQSYKHTNGYAKHTLFM